MNCNYFLKSWFAQWAFPWVAAPSMTSLLSGGPAWSDTSLIALKGAQGRIRFLQALSCGQSCTQRNIQMTPMIKTVELKWRRDASSLSFPFYLFFNGWLHKAVNHFETEWLLVISLALCTPQLLAQAGSAVLPTLWKWLLSCLCSAFWHPPPCSPASLPPSILVLIPPTLLDSIPHAPSAAALSR